MLPAKLAALAVLLAGTVFGQSTGNIIGTVFDSQTGRPIPGTAIAVNGGSSSAQVANADGKFSIAVSPGTYTLKFTADNYSDVNVSDVIVKAGESTEASTVMGNKSLVTTVEVSEKANAVTATAEAMLTERKLSAVVSDSLSKEELSGGVAGDAAGAVQKVTGVSVVGEGFVYVRGLGERYSATMLNNSVIPSTEPEKRVVPLDLFPAGLIDNIKILKTYSPDLPSEFSGGLVQMSTVEFPAERIFNASFKTGFNSRTTFDRFLTSPATGNDFFGFGSGARALPSTIPVDARLFPGRFSPEQFQTFGRAFSNNWEPTANSSMRPALDWSVVGGGTFGRFGIIGALSFSNAPQTQSEYQRYYRQGGSGPIPFTTYENFTEYEERARLGGVLNVAVRLTPNQKLVFRNTLTRDSEKSSRSFTGYDGGVDGTLSSERLRFIERSLFSTSVEGDHFLPKLLKGVLKWQFTYSRSSRDEPDLREVFRGQLPNGTFTFAALGSSGVRFFSYLQDRIYEPQADFSVPFFKGKFSGIWKTGFRASVRERDFSARRFRYIPQQSSTLNLLAPSNVLFGPDNIRPSGFQITEFTRATDRYDATMNIYGGYSMVDLAIGAKWRIVGGVRVENADMRVTTIDNLVPNATPTRAVLQNTDPTPGVNVIYALTPRQNVRVSWSRTVTRPDFRELSPFDFNNVLGGFVVQGNPNLKRGTIQNTDIRWESFLGGNQVIAASFFVKNFNNPIEQTILPSNDLRQTFVNAKGALNYGVELEFRKNLVSWNKKLKNFSISSNLTLVDSNIDINPSDVGVVTSQSRALLGQSRYIFNFIPEWKEPKWRSSARFYVNYVSRRVSGVGTFRLPDIYQEGNTFLNFIYAYSFTESGKWSMRFEAENLGDTPYLWTQGGLTQRRYQTGRNFQIGVTYAFSKTNSK